jgi:hypothetical protein
MANTDQVLRSEVVNLRVTGSCSQMSPDMPMALARICTTSFGRMPASSLSRNMAATGGER